MKQTWFGSMSIEQAKDLIPTFAQLTVTGWEIPKWLHHLIQQIQLRDKEDNHG